MEEFHTVQNTVSSCVARFPGRYNPLGSLLDDLLHEDRSEILSMYQNDVKILARERHALQRDLRRKDLKLVAVTSSLGRIQVELQQNERDLAATRVMLKRSQDEQQSLQQVLKVKSDLLVDVDGLLGKAREAHAILWCNATRFIRKLSDQHGILGLLSQQWSPPKKQPFELPSLLGSPSHCLSTSFASRGVAAVDTAAAAATSHAAGVRAGVAGSRGIGGWPGVGAAVADSAPFSGTAEAVRTGLQERAEPGGKEVEAATAAAAAATPSQPTEPTPCTAAFDTCSTGGQHIVPSSNSSSVSANPAYPSLAVAHTAYPRAAATTEVTATADGTAAALPLAAPAAAAVAVDAGTSQALERIEQQLSQEMCSLLSENQRLHQQLSACQAHMQQQASDFEERLRFVETQLVAVAEEREAIKQERAAMAAERAATSDALRLLTETVMMMHAQFAAATGAVSAGSTGISRPLSAAAATAEPSALASQQLHNSAFAVVDVAAPILAVSASVAEPSTADFVSVALQEDERAPSQTAALAADIIAVGAPVVVGGPASGGVRQGHEEEGKEGVLGEAAGLPISTPSCWDGVSSAGGGATPAGSITGSWEDVGDMMQE
jgi:hypothetical protein